LPFFFIADHSLIERLITAKVWKLLMCIDLVADPH
jgi:hypothetical protein